MDPIEAENNLTPQQVQEKALHPTLYCVGGRTEINYISKLVPHLFFFSSGVMNHKNKTGVISRDE